MRSSIMCMDFGGWSPGYCSPHEHSTLDGKADQVGRQTACHPLCREPLTTQFRQEATSVAYHAYLHIVLGARLGCS